MKARGVLFAAALVAGGSTARADGTAAPPVTIEAPPGWADAGASRRISGALITLKGPEASSFVVARADGAPRDSASGALAYLTKLVDGLRAGSGADFRAAGVLETRTFRNGVSIQLLRATLGGKPRLIVALVDAGGPPLVATLASAAPEAMLNPLFGSLRSGAPEGEVRSAGVERSLDAQLELALGGGLRARALSAAERDKGVVLALQGAGSEVVFLKLSEEDAAAKDQAGIVRATVADAAKVPLDSVSPARPAATPAGPGAVYAWARLPDSPDLRFAAGYLPWQYWGYSLLARGPQADELLVGALAALKAGPAAVPKLVASTPKLDDAEPDEAVARYGPAASIALVLLLGAAWSLGRKKGNLHS
jgi:hypothetical protein